MEACRILLIVNPASAVFVKELIAESFDLLAEKNQAVKKTKKNKHDIPVVDSAEKLTGYLEGLSEWPEHIFITPELNWRAIELFDQGYQIACQLFDKCPDGCHFQLSFLSVADEEQLLRLTSYQYHSIIRNFQHYSIKKFIPAPAFFTGYTRTHFELLKAVVISDSGRLDKIKHDLDMIKRHLNLDAAGATVQMQVLLNELRGYEHLLGRQVELSCSPECDWAELFAMTGEFVDEISGLLPVQKAGAGKSGKQGFKVLIVEDKAGMRDFLIERFSNRFSDVKALPISNEGEPLTLAEARKFLEESCKDVSVFILDLLYSDDANKTLNFSGLDLYDIILELYPFAAVRILTSMPRSAISHISETALLNKIPISHLLSKTEDLSKLETGLVQFMDEVIRQSVDNERYITAYKSTPKLSFFSHPGIQNQLYHLITHQEAEFSKLIQEAFNLYEEAKNNPDFRLELSQTSARLSFTEFKIKLPAIMAYRLLIIDASEKIKKTLMLRVDAKEPFASGSLKIRRMGNKQLLQTQLGFHAELKTREDEEVFIIQAKNFFSYERVFLADSRTAFDQSLSEKRLTGPVFDWFTEIMVDKVVYQNFKYLKLSWQLYNDAVFKANGAVTLKEPAPAFLYRQLNDLLRSILGNFDIPEVQDIADRLVTHHFIENKDALTTQLHPNTIELYELIAEAFYSI